MTQPDQHPTAAASAALLALEATTRRRIASQVAPITPAVLAALGPLVRAGDGAPPLTGGQVISHPDVYGALDDTLSDAQTNTQDTTSGAYTAAAVLAVAALTPVFASLGHDIAGDPPNPGTGTLAALLASIALAFGDARAGISRDLTAAVDGITGPFPGNVGNARIVAAHAALDRAQQQLHFRVNAAAVVAVHTGYSDTELALWRDYVAINPYINVRKRWVVQSPMPCRTCASLDGITVGLHEDFPHDSPNRLPVWDSLQRPPRHPNCRCRLAFET